MITDNEILESNKLIAEFMQAEVLNDPDLKFTWYRLSDKPALKLPELEYNSSWDWLMPSWGKLSLKLIATERFDIIERFKNAVVTNDIQVAYKVLIEGIKIINRPLCDCQDYKNGFVSNSCPIHNGSPKKIDSDWN